MDMLTDQVNALKSKKIMILNNIDPNSHVNDEKEKIIKEKTVKIEKLK